ncbi:MAG: YkgJ family cysteine cluster protein [Alphaproteobacteria bacterium]|nr:YkgJ family cysteine cluster protein [Alphaproteobacteria bacterium]
MSKFKCTHCGDCCTLAPFEEVEKDRVLRFYNIEFVRSATPGGHIFYLLKAAVETSRCPFFVKNENGWGKCEIYDIRPKICRGFGKGPKDMSCPHIKRSNKRNFQK